MKLKKRIRRMLSICIMLVLCVQILAPTSNVFASTVKLNKTKLTLNVGETATLKLTGTKKTVTWSSSKKSVATVSKKGKVSAKKEGTATITAKVSGKKYTCKVTVKKIYGKVEGNITYFYNKYRGNVADTNATVILIPKDGRALDMPNFSSYVFWDIKSMINLDGNKYGVYSATVDGKGEFVIPKVPVGEYIIYVKSKNTNDGYAFDDLDSHKNSISDIFYGYLSEENADMIAESAGYNKVVFDNITVYEDDTTVFSFDFGITYI